MEMAPLDGRFVATLNGSEAVTFAYFEDGKWFAPFDANDETRDEPRYFRLAGWIFPFHSVDKLGQPPTINVPAARTP